MSTTHQNSKTLSDLIHEINGHRVLTEVMAMAGSLNAHLYLVGGAVRDGLNQGSLPADLDIAVTNHQAVSLAEKVAQHFEGHLVPLDEEHGIYRVVMGELHLDIADALSGDIQLDLTRRDLSVNAMAINLETGEFLDPFQGSEDLSSGIIRMLSVDNFQSDPLRMLRVFRIAAHLQAKSIDKETLSAVSEHHRLIHQAAAERIQLEIFKLLSSDRCFPYLKQMGESGLLEAILPEMKAMRDIPPNQHHHLWLYDHTLELVNQSESLIHEFSDRAKADLLLPVTPTINRFGIVKLGCLLHDIGKPGTMDVRDDGRHTFYGHDKVSEEMTAVIAKRLKISKDITTMVKKLVRWHLYPCQFGPESSRKSVLRFFRRMGEMTPDVILLALSDRYSTKGPAITEEILNRSHHDHVWLMNRYYEELETLRLPRLITGKEVMGILGIKPGPVVGDILDALREVQELGEVSTADEAKDWILAQYKS